MEKEEEKRRKKDRRNYERKAISLKNFVDNCNEDRPR